MPTTLLDAAAAENGGTGIEDAGADGAEGVKAGEGAGESEEEEGHETQPEKGKRNPKIPEEVQRAVDQRIAKRVKAQREAEGRAKQAEDELKSFREREDAEGSELVLEAAREAGVMPQMVRPEEAKGLTELSNARANVRAFDRMLDSDEEEFTIGGQTLKRAEVKAQKRAWDDQAQRLERRYGSVEGRAREKALEVWKLGMAAQRAGWKPGAKAEERVEDGAGDERRPERAAGRTGPDDARGRAPAREARGSEPGADYSQVSAGKVSLLD